MVLAAVTILNIASFLDLFVNADGFITEPKTNFDSNYFLLWIFICFIGHLRGLKLGNLKFTAAEMYHLWEGATLESKLFVPK